MDLSLKKARKLEAKIATFINQKKTELNTQESIRLSSDITAVTTQVGEFRTTFFDNLKLVNNLITIRQEIRDQISEANFNTGIDNLISNKVLLENKIAVLNAFVGHDIYDQGEVEDVLALGKKQLEGGSHYVRTSTEISFLNQVDKDKIRIDKQSLQKEIEAIEDKLAELNYSSKLRLNSITTKLLQDNNLI